MRHKTLRSCLAILSSLLLAGPPVQARSVEINEVIQVLGSFRSPELQLGSIWQDEASRNSVVKTAYWAPRQSGTAVPEGSITSNSLFAAVLILPEQQQSTVETIGRGTVQGTVCDCGEILVAGGGFPKWPLIFLAAIPFFFIDRGDSSPTPSPSPTPVPTTTPAVPTPTPPPPPPPVPEPGSLLLLGTGLAAFFFGLRRRFKAKNLISKTTEAVDEWRIQK